MQLYERIFYKAPEPLEIFVDSYNSFPDIDAGVLFNSFLKLLARHTESHTPNIRKIIKDLVTIEQKIDELERLIRTSKYFYFEQIFSSNTSKYEIIVTFLAVLELMKRQSISIVQTRNFDKILIRSN
ncbi:Segregation and condensation protein A [bioreactor metagenome]|uniref:Segregation and condensation protein A n=1 Tax=bioreactor metagenome TaxID=1076179 RepID=A0A645GGJ2_9ZZZZ